jgi:hypothetical protein
MGYLHFKYIFLGALKLILSPAVLLHASDILTCVSPYLKDRTQDACHRDTLAVMNITLRGFFRTPLKCLPGSCVDCTRQTTSDISLLSSQLTTAPPECCQVSTSYVLFSRHESTSPLTTYELSSSNREGRQRLLALVTCLDYGYQHLARWFFPDFLIDFSCLEHSSHLRPLLIYRYFLLYGRCTSHVLWRSAATLTISQAQGSALGVHVVLAA